MREVRHIRGTHEGFREAYRRCALDLHLARGGGADAFVPPKDEWYLDDRVRMLAYLSQDTIQGFVIYSKSSFFYTDTDGEVLDIWVADTFRRKGVGHALAAKALQSLHGRIGLQVHAGNHVSLLFWESLAAEIGAGLDKEAQREGSDTVWRLTITMRNTPNEAPEDTANRFAGPHRVS